MANRILEQMLLDEHKRVTSGKTAAGSKPAGLLDLPHSAASTPAAASPKQPKPTMLQPAAASPATTFSKAAVTLAGAQINKGYTTPAPAPQSPASAASRGGGVAGEVGKTALKLFTSGLGVMPLVSGLAGLFGGGETAAPASLVKYGMPRSIQVTAANSRGGGNSQLADYSQDGAARSYSGTSGGGSPAAGGSMPSMQPAGQSTGGGATPQVVVNVQAMDSRSFLDHSQEIAQAVRDAMLNMHALNDVVSEL